ncbi:MAG: hypothetical protein JWN93_3743, partial [Hyphomicrobiales bacterium]|nr:hypothetical protein [Hyphomicrobiales bacterium]
MTSIIYVDAVNGSDKNTGLSGDAPVRSLAAANALLTDGAQLLLHAGQTWSETLWLRTSNVTVGAYGTGANPLIDGGGARHGIVVQSSGVTVNSIDVSHAWNGIYVTGTGASVTIHGGVYDGNGTGLVAGGGGVFTLVDGSICKNSTLKLGAGDGIQVSEDASAGLHTFINVQCYGNEKQGLNFKIGRADVSNGVFEHNGETGVLGQVNASYMNLNNNNISYNNTANNGTFNLGLENSVEVHSTGNVYADPTPGSLAYNNINMSGATKFYSTGDTFIESSSMTTNFGSSIRIHTEGNASVVEVHSPVFQVSHAWGWFIDAYGATGSKVSAYDTDFSVLPDTEYRAPDGSTPDLFVTASTTTTTPTTPTPIVDLTLNGASTADVLTGAAGNDTLDGKAGADKLYG